MRAEGANRLLQAANAYKSQASDGLRRKMEAEPPHPQPQVQRSPQQDLARSIGKGTYVDIRV